MFLNTRAWRVNDNQFSLLSASRSLETMFLNKCTVPAVFLSVVFTAIVAPGAASPMAQARPLNGCIPLSPTPIFKSSQLTDLVGRGPVPPLVPADPGSPKVRELRKERLGILRERLTQTEKSYQTGNVSLSQYLDAQRVILSAELELCETDKERVVVLAKDVELMKRQENIVRAIVQKGFTSQSDLIEVRLARIEAEIALELVRSKLAASK